ncbi:MULTISPECIES: peptide ABC transporter substrate-binding protein [unclassified Rhizobium]|uniref:peptide ABC transporter substrate-binding protein n=1 Tax=unclassified Rhizobium TaxID=2613769 RepID=UPI0007130FC3|nr:MULTISPECIES: peptide ABC transporter substrate-binding protein [unclassified Rhizobium]KQS87622.1 ABC transporter substrate-binding protein [Rhizobium sp. Leaf391]KQT07058.1 ABC transporter substrate-binding protein [Rhizobium sp. Leaf386]KQT95184.1 ABC transporter substrate-binding protein [Rhizobium sp. Leaf453]
MTLAKFNLRTAILLGSILIGASPALAETVLHRGNAGEPQTLDQAHTSINIEEFILKDLYEGLTIYDASGKIVPGTAESWDLSDDGLVYTFKLRADAKWSDGSPVTAEDFAFSLKRVEDPKTAAGYANILFPIKNAEKVNKGEVPLDQLGVKAVDEKTLEITLERPTPFFLELLAHQTALPVSKASVEKNGADFVKPGVMVSNGAYKLVAHTPNDTLTTEKNPSYWDAANVKIDKVIFYPIDDQAASVRRFEAKEMDLAYNFSADQIDRLKKAYGEQVHVSSALATYYYAFDTRQEPYSDVRVRRALSMAVDRDFLAKDIYSGSQLPSYSMVPFGMAGYEPGKADFADMSQLDREDEALKLMKEAGYGEGGKPLKIEIRYNTNPNHERVATAVADMWKNTFGAEVSLVNLDVSSHYAYLQEGGKFNVARAGWTADYADAENFLALSVGSNKTFNYGHFENAEFDGLMKKSYEEIDPTKRAKILHDAETLLMKEQPIAPFLSQAELWLVSDRVKGWQDNAANQHLSKFLSIAE